MTTITVRSPHTTRVVATYDDDHGLNVTDPKLSRHLQNLRDHEGGVPSGPDGPRQWTPHAILDYLEASDYELDTDAQDQDGKPPTRNRRYSLARRAIQGALDRATRGDPSITSAARQLLSQLNRAEDSDDTTPRRARIPDIYPDDTPHNANWLAHPDDTLEALAPEPKPFKRKPIPDGMFVLAVRRVGDYDPTSPPPTYLLTDHPVDRVNTPVDTMGQIWDPETGELYPPERALGIIQFGYWQPPVPEDLQDTPDDEDDATEE